MAHVAQYLIITHKSFSDSVQYLVITPRNLSVFQCLFNGREYCQAKSIIMSIVEENTYIRLVNGKAANAYIKSLKTLPR